MGQVTSNMSIYIPAAGETNYDASFAVGMINIDQHNHSGPPDGGVQLTGTSIAPASITFDLLNPNVADNASGIGTLGGPSSNKLTLLRNLPAISNLSTAGYISVNGTSAYSSSLIGTTNQIDVTNGTGGGNSVFSLKPIVQQLTQPKFSYTLSTTTGGVTGDGTTYSVPFDTVLFDTSLTTDFNTSTGTFTAPVTGYYWLNGSVNVQSISGAMNLCFVNIVTSGGVYDKDAGNVGAYYEGTGNLTFSISCIAYMALGDTANVTIKISGGALAAKVQGTGASPYETLFQGYLLM